MALKLIASHQQGISVAVLPPPQGFTAAFVRQPIYVCEWEPERGRMLSWEPVRGGGSKDVLAVAFAPAVASCVCTDPSVDYMCSRCGCPTALVDITSLCGFIDH